MFEFYRIVDTWVDRKIAERVAIGTATLSATAYFDRRGIVEEDRLDQMLANLRELYDNTSSLLTHISAMIAVLGIMLVFAKEDLLFQRLIEAEIMLYTIMAVLCVYNLRRYSIGRAIAEHYLDDIYESYVKRRYIYVIYTDGVLVITLIFLVMVFMHFLFG